VLGLAFGCGGAVVHSDQSGTAGSSHGGKGSGSSGATSTAGSLIGRSGSAGSAGGELPDAGLEDPDPVDSGCPVQELPPPDFECDPLSAGACGAGAGCYPFVDHPEGSGCDQQRYGTVCLPAGQGTQGALCGDDVGDWCAAGFVCVVGQRAGKRCAALCELGAPNTFQGGLLCSDLDVAGFGVCG
jgi:hypothetical protein